MPHVHRAFSVLQHRVTQPAAETAAGCESGLVRWGQRGRRKKKRKSVSGDEGEHSFLFAGLLKEGD